MARQVHTLKYTRAELDAILDKAADQPFIIWHDEAAGVYRFFPDEEKANIWIQAYMNQELTPEIDAYQFAQPITAPAPDLDSKQDKLISGENIKTINGESILGSGNLDIEGGSGQSVLYIPQSLTEEQRSQARQNIGAGTSNFDGSYNSLDDLPTIPTVPEISQDLSDDASSTTKTTSPKAVKDYVDGEVGSVENAISLINGKIPSAASSENQLADKNYVNSQISTNTATFRGTYETFAELELVTATNNDYVFVIEVDSLGNEYFDRYKYVAGTGWVYEYKVENTSFTSDQWAAIQSGITAALVTKLDALPTNTDLSNILDGKANKSEMSVVPGEGGNADKTTITLKTGTSATVLTQHQLVSGFATKVQNAVNGNFAGLDSNGNLTDSGHKHSDYLTQHQDISGKANKDEMSVVAGTGANADKTTITLKEGTSATVLTQHQDISGKQDVIQDLSTIRSGASAGATAYQKPDTGIPSTDLASEITEDIDNKADKVSSPVSGNFAGLDSNGNLTDSGSKASDFVTSTRAIPPGGIAGQVLEKVSSTNYDITWANQTAASAYCSTAGDTAAKRANCSLYKLVANQYLQVLIGSDNTSASALTLEVNSQGQKPIYINGVASSSTNYTLPGSTYIVFYDGTNYYFRTDGKIQGPGGTLELTANKVTSITSLSTDTEYPGAKCVYSEVHPAVGSSQPSGGMLPNVMYNLGTLTGTVTFSMASATDNTIINHWYWTFGTSSTAPTITWPQAITSWYGGSAPTINASKHYEISVLNGIGVAMEV